MGNFQFNVWKPNGLRKKKFSFRYYVCVITINLVTNHPIKNNIPKKYHHNKLEAIKFG